MARRKKKKFRITRNPGITVVFTRETRERIEAEAAGSGVAKATFIARSMERSLGISSAIAANEAVEVVATATPTAQTLQERQADLDRVWGGAIRIVQKETPAPEYPILDTVSAPEPAPIVVEATEPAPVIDSAPADRSTAASDIEADTRDPQPVFTLEPMAPIAELPLPAESKPAEPVPASPGAAAADEPRPMLDEVPALEPSTEPSDDELDARARRFVQNGGSVPPGAGLIGA